MLQCFCAIAEVAHGVPERISTHQNETPGRDHYQPAFNCSNSTMETSEQCVKSVQS